MKFLKFLTKAVATLATAATLNSGCSASADTLQKDPVVQQITDKAKEKVASCDNNNSLLCRVSDSTPNVDSKVKESILKKSLSFNGYISGVMCLTKKNTTTCFAGMGSPKQYPKSSE